MKPLDILKEYWGYDSFRGIQHDIIESILDGRDTLGLMPTGGGKSICFQVPALMSEGLCIVVTPLISLMKDQVLQLKRRGIRAEAVYSGMMRDDIIRVLDNAVLGGYKLLYISPERLSSELFLAKLARMRQVSMIVVDEAHCISQWGYDFRPSYLQIATIRRLLPVENVPVLALTATATPKVVDDIQERLGFRKKNVFSMSFERKNLIYVVRETEDRAGEMLHILQGVPEGSAIVYTRTRQQTIDIARYLEENNITASNYHAGLTDAEKDYRQINWTKGRVRVMVATNAFGMGIDKPDVRLVIHYHMPDSLEAYFQEAGRAGRDGKTSYAVLLYNYHDLKTLNRRVAETYPDLNYVKQTYENVSYFLQVGIGEALGRTFYFPMETFCRTFHQFPVQTQAALQLLNNAGYIEYHEEQEFKSALHFILRKEELYRIYETDEETDLLIQQIYSITCLVSFIVGVCFIVSYNYGIKSFLLHGLICTAMLLLFRLIKALNTGDVELIFSLTPYFYIVSAELVRPTFIESFVLFLIATCAFSLCMNLKKYVKDKVSSFPFAVPTCFCYCGYFFIINICNYMK